MRITISFPPGFEVEGFVLSLHGNSMRVAMRDWDDAAVFEFSGGQWLSENGDLCRVYTSGPPAEIPAAAMEEIIWPRMDTDKLRSRQKRNRVYQCAFVA
jgi:hypothetical protein